MTEPAAADKKEGGSRLCQGEKIQYSYSKIYKRYS